MFNWLRKKLGIDVLAAQVWKTQGQVMKLQGTVRKLQNKTRLGKAPQRYDEIQRAQSRRRKGAHA